jgi:hypothetical protein
MKDDETTVPVPPNDCFYGGVRVWVEFGEAYSFLYFPYTWML